MRKCMCVSLSVCSVVSTSKRHIFALFPTLNSFKSYCNKNKHIWKTAIFLLTSYGRCKKNDANKDYQEPFKGSSNVGLIPYVDIHFV